MNPTEQLEYNKARLKNTKVQWANVTYAIGLSILTLGLINKEILAIPFGLILIIMGCTYSTSPRR